MRIEMLTVNKVRKSFSYVQFMFSFTRWLNLNLRHAFITLRKNHEAIHNIWEQRYNRQKQELRNRFAKRCVVDHAIQHTAIGEIKNDIAQKET